MDFTGMPKWGLCRRARLLREAEEFAPKGSRVPRLELGRSKSSPGPVAAASAVMTKTESPNTNESQEKKHDEGTQFYGFMTKVPNFAVIL